MDSNPPPIVVLGLAGVVLWLAATDGDARPTPPPDLRLPPAINALIPTPEGVQPAECAQLTVKQLREMVLPFEPAPGHSYPWSRVTVKYCRQLSDHVRPDGSTVARYLYQSEVNLSLAALVENDRVIGLQYFPQE